MSNIFSLKYYRSRGVLLVFPCCVGVWDVGPAYDIKNLGTSIFSVLVSDRALQKNAMFGRVFLSTEDN